MVVTIKLTVNNQKQIIYRKRFYHIQVKAKNQKMAEYLRWKITWEIGKFKFFKNKQVANSDFGSDHHLVVRRRHSYKKSKVYDTFIISALKLTISYWGFLRKTERKAMRQKKKLSKNEWKKNLYSDIIKTWKFFKKLLFTVTCYTERKNHQKYWLPLFSHQKFQVLSYQKNFHWPSNRIFRVLRCSI